MTSWFSWCGTSCLLSFLRLEAEFRSLHSPFYKVAFSSTSSWGSRLGSYSMSCVFLIDCFFEARRSPKVARVQLFFIVYLSVWYFSLPIVL